MLGNSLNPLNPNHRIKRKKKTTLLEKNTEVGRKFGEEWWCQFENARTALHQAKDRMKQNVDKNRV